MNSSAHMLILTLLLLPSVKTQLNFMSMGGFGQCPNPTVKDNFEISNYKGVWYEYQRLPAPFEFLLKCGEATYEILNDTYMSVTNRGLRELKIGNMVLYRHWSDMSGIAKVVNSLEPAKLSVTFPHATVYGNGPYWVLDTDYTSYAVVYSCVEIFPGLAHTEFAWILTRQRGRKPDNMDALYVFLHNNGVKADKFFTVDQHDCTESGPKRTFKDLQL